MKVDVNFWIGYYAGLSCGLFIALVVVLFLFRQVKKYIKSVEEKKELKL